MEMPCICPGCGDVVELNDMRRDPCDPTRTGLVCEECADARADDDPFAERLIPKNHKPTNTGETQ